MKRMHKWAVAAALLGAGQTWALDIQNVTPQGQVAEIRQLVVRLDADAVALGSAEGPVPDANHTGPSPRCARHSAATSSGSAAGKSG